MTIEELIAVMEKVEKEYRGDPARIHSLQDDAFLAYINDDRVTNIYFRTPLS